MIPDTKTTAVQHALQVAFSVNEFEDIRELTAGLSSALIFRIVVQGKPFLLRIITRTDPISDPAHHFDSMKAAADAGFAPRIRYASLADRIYITDFVDTKPFRISEARMKLPVILKRLHALPPFLNRLNFLDTMNGFVQKFQAAKILPEHKTENLFRQYAHIKHVYPRNPDDLVSCHNDLKPENILFDGDQVWLVDWEAAFLNDRYVDLAVVGNFVVKNDHEEKEYLKSYFGEGLNEYHHARFFLMSQLMHLFYFTFFMSQVSAAGKTIDLDSAKPEFSAFHDLMWAGKINLADHDNRQQYAWVHMQKLLHNLQTKRFADSLHIVSSYQNHKKLFRF